MGEGGESRGVGEGGESRGVEEERIVVTEPRRSSEPLKPPEFS